MPVPYGSLPNVVVFIVACSILEHGQSGGIVLPSARQLLHGSLPNVVVLVVACSILEHGLWLAKISICIQIRHIGG